MKSGKPEAATVSGFPPEQNSPKNKRDMIQRVGKVLLISAVLLTAWLAGGCFYRDARRNLENADRLRVGMTKADVLEIMGEPQQNEVYTRPDVWFYYTRTNWIDGLATEEECTPLVFREGMLIGWGHDFYAKYRLVPPAEREKSQLTLPE